MAVLAGERRRQCERANGDDAENSLHESHATHLQLSPALEERNSRTKTRVPKFGLYLRIGRGRPRQFS
jgi:hypothetical protein